MAGSHAVQRVAITMSFPEEVTSFLVEKAVSAARPTARKMGFLIESEFKTVFSTGLAGGVQQPGQSNQEGVAFGRATDAQTVQSFFITRKALRFETLEYTRWAVLKAEIVSLFTAVLPILAQSTPAATVELEYVDFFYAATEGPEDVGLILDRNAKLIPLRAYRRWDPFHSHAGWFEERFPEGQNLVNVNIDVADASGPMGPRRTISIRTFEAEHVGEQVERGAELMLVENALASLDVLHNSLKKRLGALLTREASSMISLSS